MEDVNKNTKQMRRKIGRWVKLISLLLSLFVLGYLALAVLLSWISTHPHLIEGEKTHEIFVSSNGVHLDIIVPKKELNESLSTALMLPAATEYVAFGWGDKGFYLNTPKWSDLTFSTAVRALLLKSETAIHLTMYRSESNKWQPVEINEVQLELLLAYISQSFQTDQDGQFIELPDSGYTNADTFYEAIGSYNLIVTCNSWVNRGLKAAQIKTSIWSPFDRGVLYQVKRQNRKLQGADL
jgi:uncharacterized protein (TIGR02117 family)